MSEPNELPSSWERVALGELGEWFGGGTPNTENVDFWADGSIPWVSPKDMKSDVIHSTIDKITPEAVAASATKLVPADAVLMVMRSGILRHSFPVATTEQPVALNQDLKALKPHDGINARYLAYALRALAMTVLETCAKDGTTVQSIEFGLLKKLPIPLAPSAQQERIVAKLDELFSDIEAGEKALERARTLIGRYRQSVLKAAVTGELTRDWREKNLDRLKAEKKTGADLLADILTKRRKAWEAAELAKMRATGREPTGDHWKARYKEPAAPDVSGLPELPEGWAWAALDALAQITGGVTVDQKRRPDNPVVVPYLRVANVQRGFLDLAEIKQIAVEAETAETLRLVAGDILFTEGGDRDKLGRGWIWNDELPLCIHQNHIFRARLYGSSLRPEFISHFGNVMGARYFSEQGKQTTNLASVSLSKLKSFPVPIPPTQELPQIIDAVERHLSVIDRCRAEVDANARRSTQTRQALLTAAFSGRLVPQDPSVEPASELLARIAGEGKGQSLKPARKAPTQLPSDGLKAAAIQTSLFD